MFFLRAGIHPGLPWPDRDGKLWAMEDHTSALPSLPTQYIPDPTPLPRRHLIMSGGIGNQLYVLAHVRRLQLADYDVSYHFASSGNPREFGLGGFHCPQPVASVERGVKQEFGYWQCPPPLTDPVFASWFSLRQPPSDDAQRVRAAAQGQNLLFVRRGDFTNAGDNRAMAAAWFKSATLGRPHQIITDDEPWAERYLSSIGPVIPTEGLAPADILWGAAHADEFLLSPRSTFGQWAQWLSCLVTHRPLPDRP